MKENPSEILVQTVISISFFFNIVFFFYIKDMKPNECVPYKIDYDNILNIKHE